MDFLIPGLLVALAMCICGILIHQSRRDAMKHTKDTNDQLLQHNERLMQWTDYLLRHWDDSLQSQIERFTDIIGEMEAKLARAVGDAASEVFDTVHGDRTMHVGVRGKAIAIREHGEQDVDDPEATRVDPPRQEKA